MFVATIASTGAWTYEVIHRGGRPNRPNHGPQPFAIGLDACSRPMVAFYVEHWTENPLGQVGSQIWVYERH